MSDPRPPSILSEHGEGYCRVCRFVVGLTSHGLLNDHTRGIGSYGSTEQCKGSGKKPPSVTPYASRKAAFKVNTPLGECPVCGRRVALRTESTLAAHTRRPYPYEQETCIGSLNPPAGWRPAG